MNEIDKKLLEKIQGIIPMVHWWADHTGPYGAHMTREQCKQTVEILLEMQVYLIDNKHMPVICTDK